MRALSPTFDDHWTQPRLFYNSLTPVEQQFLINAIRFETSHLKSATVKQNVLTQLNRVSHDIAVRVAAALGLEAPAADGRFYHENKTAGVGTFGERLLSIKTLRVGVLASVKVEGSVKQAGELKTRLEKDGVVVTVVGESLAAGVDQTYSAADATGFDGVVVVEGAEGLFDGSGKASPLFPAGRPGQVLLDAYRWGKPVGALGKAEKALKGAGVPVGTPGVFVEKGVEGFVKVLEGGLEKFRVSSSLLFWLDSEEDDANVDFTVYRSLPS